MLIISCFSSVAVDVEIRTLPGGWSVTSVRHQNLKVSVHLPSLQVRASLEFLLEGRIFFEVYFPVPMFRSTDAFKTSPPKLKLIGLVQVVSAAAVVLEACAVAVAWTGVHQEALEVLEVSVGAEVETAAADSVAAGAWTEVDSVEGAEVDLRWMTCAEGAGEWDHQGRWT